MAYGWHRLKHGGARIGCVESSCRFGVAGTNTIERFYDVFGRDAGYALNGVRQSTLGYDAATGRLVTMQDAGSDTPFTWSYLAGSDLKSSLVYPNGLTANWTYGNRGELLEVNNASPTGTISRYAYTYDAAGRRVACAKSGTAFERSDSVNYGYNARSELTSATAAVDSAYRYGYNFDDIGNRKTSSERGINSVYTASQLNQYTAVDDFTPTYDADGNETLVKTATGIWQVTYNGENRPVRWENGDSVITMSYDRMGRRVTKNDQRFVYNGYLQIANFHSTTTTSDYNYFIWDPTEPVATRPLAWTTPTTNHQSPTTSFYTHDGNKNVSEVIASDTDVAAHYEYAPFGALTVSCGESAAANPWRFSSEYAEDDTATVYYNYRHYEPLTGRWMSRDPYREEEDTVFVNNDSNELFDWLGLDWEVSSCVSISHSKYFDFRQKPLGRIAAIQFNGTLAFDYSLKGEACIKCCKKGVNAGLDKWSGSGEVKLSGEGGITATLGVDFKTDLFWNFYKLYLFGGVQASVMLSGSGTGSFEFDGCEGTGTLNASIADSLEFAIRGGVEGHLKRRGSRRNGNWHYNNIARVAALIKGDVSTSLETKLVCNTEKCTLISSYGGVEVNVGLEFTFWREQLTLDLLRLQREGHVIAEMEFESPLKGWVE